MDKYKDIDVLIIEDDLIAQMALKQMLQEIGFLRIDCAAEVPTARKLVSKKNLSDCTPRCIPQRPGNRY